MDSRSHGHPLAPAALLILLSFTVPSPATARPGTPAPPATPVLVAPAEGERLVESAARFAFEVPRSLDRPVFVLSRRPFDPAGWAAVPDDPGLIVHAAEGPVLALADLDAGVDADTRLWWAIAARDRDTGALRMSPVRSFTALRKFANRVAPSPYLPPARLGTLAALGAGDTPAGPDVIGSRAARAPATGATRTPPRIRLAAGYDWAPAEGEPVLPPGLSSAGVPRVEGGTATLRSYLVQFDAPPGPTEMAAIAAAGGAVVGYIPDHAYLVRMSAGARAALAGGAGGGAGEPPAWIGEYEPAYKLSPALDRAAPGEIECVALLFADADLPRERDGIVALGAAVLEDSDNGINKLLRFRIPASAIPAIASLPAVEWVEPAPRFETFNDLAQWVVQTNLSANRRVWTMGIRGQGQVVMTSDSGILTTHNQHKHDTANSIPISDFGDYPTHRRIIAYKKGSTSSAVVFGDHSGASWHGTHTAGTLCGNDDPISSSTRDGMAKEAKIYFMDIGGPTLGTGLSTFPDLNDLFLPAYTGNAGGAARVSSHSWGGSPLTAYTLNSMQVDQFIWNHPDFYIAFANGNAAAAATVASPATAKSVAAMGGTQNGANAGLIYTSTSRGPTADNRRKPAFCSPGQNVFSAVGPATGYAGLSGTSMATPSGTGAVVLMRQYLTDGWYPTGAAVPANGFTPSAALLKAMAINSAENAVSGFTAPDNNIGYGRVNADNVLYFAGDARKLLLVDNTTGLAHGQYLEYQINVVDGAVPFEVSLCWSDYPGNPAASVQLVNNLDLTVSKDATLYKGNVYSGGVSTPNPVASYDNRNVEEAVLVAAPSTGLWTVRVAAPSIPVGPQPFALVITGGVGNGAGALALDRAEYGSSATVEIQVIDTNAGATVDVSVTSGTEATPEVVTLAGSDGVYSGTLTLSPQESLADDGTLTVSNGDALTATYDDASPVTTLTAGAQVNFDTPMITNVRATSQGGAGTLVTWTTDRNATSRVYYGATPALELGSVDAVGNVLGHEVLLTGLTAGQTYHYDVESVSLSGSSARDDLGGDHYRFTAAGSADVLLLITEPSFERTIAWTSALDAGGYDYDLWTGPIAESAPLGDLAGGLRSYQAVLWQVGFEYYPPFTAAQRDTITAYLGGGGRLVTVGHDIGWGLADPTAPGYTAEGAAWLQSTLHTSYLADPLSWSQETGIASDPISGAYTGGVPYTPFRDGGAGDEIAFTGSGGSGSYVWRNNEATPDNTAFRWENSAPNGSPSTAFWGGTPSRFVHMSFEFTALAPPYTDPSATRNAILDKTIVWLLGRARPTAAVTFPNGAEVLTANSTNVTWTESVAPGRAVGQRVIEYSTDDGDSWTLLSSAAGPSPYAWDLTPVPNTASARVRVRIVDDGSPALSRLDASNAVFAIARTGGDAEGPVVVAGSIESAPNPIVRGNSATLSARVSDQATGGGTVTEAEWSYGDTPGTSGIGGALSGAFGTTTVDVSDAIPTDDFFTGSRTLWVRARDAAGNWGAWSPLSLLVNGTDPVGVGDRPAVSFLAQNAPNPFAGRTSFRFGLARAGDATLDIFDTQGRRVRRLVHGAFPAGAHAATWDGSDESGARAPAGVYLCRLVVPGGGFERRLVRVP